MTKKEKQILGFKNRNNFLRHMVDLLNIQCSQFIYEGLPETLPQEFIEFYYAINGTIAVGKVSELGESSDIYVSVGSYNGDYNGYLPDSYTAAVTGLGEISGKWYGADKTIVVGKNNLMGAPDFDIPFTAEVLSQVDISEKINVIFARLNRIPYADNDTQKAALESAIKSIIEGDLFAVANRNIKNKFDEFMEGAPQDKDKFLDLVDVDKINGLQYLNQYRDNVLKRYLSKRGYMIQTTAKLAQQTNDELHGADSYSLLYPMEQLRQRQKTWSEVNELFGTNITVRFNPILEKVYNDYMREPEQTDDQTGAQTGAQDDAQEGGTTNDSDN